MAEIPAQPLPDEPALADSARETCVTLAESVDAGTLQQSSVTVEKTADKTEPAVANSAPASQLSHGSRGSTDKGTVIMPRTKIRGDVERGVVVAPEEPSSLPLGMISPRESSAIRLDQSRGSNPPLTPEEQAELGSQQTVISRQPWGDAPLVGTINTREMGKLLAGQTLGHYTLLEFVGGGGMGAVFRSHDTMLNRVVAVKVLAPNQSRDEETLRRFQNEAQSAARLDHENIGRVHYVGQDRGWHYIVFEFIDGQNLRDLVEQRGQLTMPEIVNFLTQLGEALAHASSREVVHRDIKPSNVIITPEGKAKLVDMGLARLHQVDQPQEDLTASGVTLGTFDYISPEQARDPRTADVRSDLYSLGCTLYYMLTGRPPFPTGTVLQKLLKHQGEEPTDPRTWRDDVPACLIAILRKLMAKTPEGRYQSPQELLDALALLATPADSSLKSGKNIRAENFLNNPRVRPEWFRHLPWVAPLAIAAALAVGASWWGEETDDAAKPKLLNPNYASTKSTTVALNSPTGKSAGKSNSAAVPIDSAKLSLRTSSVLHPEPPAPDRPLEAIADTAKGALDSVRLQAAPRNQAAAGNSIWAATLKYPQVVGNYWQSLQNQYLPVLAANLPKWQFHWVNVPPNEKNQPPQAPAATNVAAKNSALEEHAIQKLIVTPKPRLPWEYDTLAAACNAAKLGSIVELQFSGVLVERPFTLTNPQLTIQAGEGQQPIIRFQPRDSAAMLRSQSMLTINGGRVTWINTHLELDLPSPATNEPWTLFELRQVRELLFDRCSLTIHNGDDPLPLHPRVNFFELRVGPTAVVQRMKEPAALREPTLIRGSLTALRGGAVILQSLEQEPAQFHWQQGMLATSETLLGADFSAPDNSPRATAAFRVELQNVTGVLGQGICRLINTRRMPLKSVVEIELADCILRGADHGPLVEIDGIERPEDVPDFFRWDAKNCLFDGYTACARFISADGTTNLAPSQWKELWREQERQTSHAALNWVTPREQLPAWHRIVPPDLKWTPKRGAIFTTETAPSLPGRLIPAEESAPPLAPPQSGEPRAIPPRYGDSASDE